MSTPSIATPVVPAVAVRGEEVDRYEAVGQYSGARIAALWAAADQSNRTGGEGLPELHHRRRRPRRPLLPGAWGLFALSALVVFLAPVEELFFRGLLLPRMRKVCGRFDWVVNGTIFTAYHLHEAWVMPTTLLTGDIRSGLSRKTVPKHLISIVAHTLPSFLMIGIILSLVLR